MEKKKLKLLVCVMALTVFLAGAASVQAAEVHWDGGGSDTYWTTAKNWVGDVLPNDTDDLAMINDPSVPQPLVDATITASAYRVIVGQDNGPCTLTVTGGSLTSSGAHFTVGRRAGGVGILNISGGDVLAAEGFIITNSSGTTGTVNMSGGTLTVQTTDPVLTNRYRHLVVADSGIGTLNLSGGIITAKNDMYLCQNSSGVGTVNMTGGTINVTDTIYISLHSTAPSEFHLDGGVVTAADLSMTANGSLDFIDGVMILDGDKEVAVQGYIDQGLITAYGISEAVLVDYGVTNPDKTTIARDPDYNAPPAVDAGSYQSLLWPDNTVQLDGTVSDDGNPAEPGQVTLIWSKLKGPGNVTFSPGNDIEDPTATFDAAGIYELQLSASDSEKDACDIVAIYVRADNSPIAHWDFNEGSGPTVNDDSANNNVGTRAGDAEPNWVTGWVGSNALEFYGNDPCGVFSYVDITTDLVPDPNIDNLRYEISLSAWIKPEETGMYIIGDSGNTLRLGASGTQPGEVYFGCNGPSGGTLYSVSLLNDGYWHHVAGVYDGSTAYMYIDGVLENSAERTGLINTNDLPVTIGARYDDATTVSQSWNCMLDDVWVYSYGLSADQVTALADMGDLIPRVDAGNDQTFSMQEGSLQLDGTVTDDGKPVAATIGWISDPCNPGTVTFSPSADIEDPCVTFSAIGTYILRLTADDTMATVYDEVAITVENPTCQDVINDGLLISSDFSGPEGTPDCRVDLYDFAAFAGNWLRCNNPQDPECEFAY